jgi:hypothetical protein
MGWGAGALCESGTLQNGTFWGNEEVEQTGWWSPVSSAISCAVAAKDAAEAWRVDATIGE